MNTPLANSIRSFWTPEVNRDPAWLRVVRLDKLVVAMLAAAFLYTTIGLVACVVGIVWTVAQ